MVQDKNCQTHKTQKWTAAIFVYNLARQILWLRSPFSRHLLQQSTRKFVLISANEEFRGPVRIWLPGIIERIEKWSGQMPVWSFPTKIWSWETCEKPCCVYSLISIGADACCLVILRTIDVRTITECPIPFSHRPSSSLIHKMPVKTCKRSVLSTLVLQEQSTLLRPKLLQIPAKIGNRVSHNLVKTHFDISWFERRQFW